MTFNGAIVFFSIGFSVGSYLIMDEGGTSEDCGGILLVLYAVICLHAVNSLVGLVNLIGKERSCCTSNMICCLGIFEITILVWMQVAYFRAQDESCMTKSPVYYFWLML